MRTFKTVLSILFLILIVESTLAFFFPTKEKVINKLKEVCERDHKGNPREMFNRFDRITTFNGKYIKDGSDGKLDESELKHLYSEIGFDFYKGMMASKTIKDYDKDKDGEISYSELQLDKIM